MRKWCLFHFSFVKSKTKQNLKILSSSGIRRAKFLFTIYQISGLLRYPVPLPDLYFESFSLLAFSQSQILSGKVQACAF